MAAKVIMCAVTLGCAVLFYSIGIYAQKLKKPMWFWSGCEVPADKISDTKRYNKENSTMWKLYSLWYLAAAITGIWNLILPVIFLVCACTVGLAILIYTYNKIYNKYKV